MATPIVPPTEPQMPYPEAARSKRFLGDIPNIVNPIGSIGGQGFSAPPPVLNNTNIDELDQATQNNQFQQFSQRYNTAAPYQTPQQPTLQPGDKSALSYAAPIMGGLQAGSAAPMTTDSTGAVLGAIGSGLSGAGQGALAGAAIGAMAGPAAPITAVGGAVIGGLTGLVSGGIQAYFGLEQARAARRRNDRAAQQAQAFEEKWRQQARQDQLYMYNTNRADTQEQLRYNRKQAAIQSQWSAMNQARDIMNNLMAQDQSFKNAFIQQER